MRFSKHLRRSLTTPKPHRKSFIGKLKNAGWMEFAGVHSFVMDQIRSRLNGSAGGRDWESVDVSKASKLRRRVLSGPRILIALGVFQLLIGLGELESRYDDGGFDTVFGAVYICAGILSFRLVRIAAAFTAATLTLFVPIWALMIVDDVFRDGLDNMRPVIFVLLGIPSILASWAILKYIRSLTPEEWEGQKAVQLRYFPRLTEPAVMPALVQANL